MTIPPEAAGETLRLVLIEREQFVPEELGEQNERAVYLDIIPM